MREPQNVGEPGSIAGLQLRERLAHGRDLALRPLDEFLAQLEQPGTRGRDSFLGGRVHCASHSALTWAPSVIGSNGLAITPMADSSRKRAVSSALALAVMKMTGMFASPASSRMRFS